MPVRSDDPARSWAASAVTTDTALDYRRILESAPALLLVLDRDEDFTILAASDGYLRATLTRGEDIVGRRLFDVFPESPGEQDVTGTSNLRASLQRVLAGRCADTTVIQNDIRRPDSEGRGFHQRCWSATNAPVLSDRGELLCIVHRLEDVTGLMRANSAFEEEHRRAEALAARDRDRTAFFAEVSHELRTPLSLMLGPVEELLAAAPAAQRAAAALVQGNAQRLLRLVNTLLDFSRVEAGRAQASYVPTDLAALTTDLAATFRSVVEKAGMELTVDCPLIPQPAWVDREMWEKIVLNLLSNAFKFTFAGGITVTLRLTDAGFALSVRDTGSGIPARALPRLFQRFRRVEGARSRTREGTGIGLALVQELARLHGGSVQVESVEERGSTFTVTIPAGKGHLPADRIGVAPTVGSSPTQPELFADEALAWLPTPERFTDRPAQLRRRVLVADDNADMRDYLRRMLSERYEVEAVPDGEAALESARRRRPDLLIADVMMPRIDGLTLARRRGEDPVLRDLPLILLSARAGQEARIEGLAAGADDYLEKPFAARELLARVAARLEISRRRGEADASVRESEEHLRAVVETSPECVKLVAADGTLLQMNPSGLAMLNAERAEMVVGKNVYDLIAPEHREAFRLFNQRICGGEKGTLEFDMVSLKGIRRQMETHGAPLKMPDGTTVHLALTRDISARRQAEEALRQSENRKDEFIATLSHELRNPLAPLRNALGLLRLARSDEDMAPVHAMMERQLNHLVRLVDDLLEMSRINRGMFELRRQRVDLGTVIRNAVEGSQPIIHEGGHRLEMQLPEEPVWLEGDPVRLAQIFSNLLNNAARFTETGGRICIAAEGRQGCALVRVRDSGQGFSPEDAERLFEMFTKGDGSAGLGIGLALARRLVEMHGGTIEARSEGGGRGAEFIVRLPLASAGAEAAPSGGQPGSVAGPPPACRVLVADDNRDAADSLADLLRWLGSEVSLAYDGAQAVEVARTFQPDLALLDIGMPKLDGYGAAQRIRQESGTRPLKLVALTGWGQEEDRRRAREAGFDEHLVKPAELADLSALLSSVAASKS
jgi:PAS domain S-box-containing protein